MKEKNFIRLFIEYFFYLPIYYQFFGIAIIQNK